MDKPRTILTDGSEVPADGAHTRLKPNGQQQEYVVLTAEERAKGFVRPVRTAYRHVGARPVHPTRPLTAQEQARYAALGYAAYEVYPTDGPVVGRYWTQAQLNSGCGEVTTMSRSIAETYAWEPGFYGGTFCTTCGQHFPVGADGEFVWEGTDERVGT